MQILSIFACLVVMTSAARGATSDALQLPMDWYPESVAVAPNGDFLVASWHQGAVARLSRDGEPASVLITPGSNGLANGQGVAVDPSSDTLWVCSGAIGFTTVPLNASALKSFSLKTGLPKGSYLVPDSGHCNDVALDGESNVYVTDSFHPRILRLAHGGEELAVWKEDSALLGPKPYVGLNGIAFDGRGALYVSLVAASTHLITVRIRADGMPGDVSVLSAPRTLKNVDALRYWTSDKLVLFESDAFGHGEHGGQITVATIVGGHLKLQTIAAGLDSPSSGVITGDRVYFVETKYKILFEHKGHEDEIPRNVPFVLQWVKLPAN